MTTPTTDLDHEVKVVRVVGPLVAHFCSSAGRARTASLQNSAGSQYFSVMPVDWNAEVVDQMESHWRHQLRPRLDGLTDDEYFWEPVPGCWSLRRRDDASALSRSDAGTFVMEDVVPAPDPAPVTTIAWRLAHLVQVVGPPDLPRYRHRVERPRTEFAASSRAALAQLDAGYEARMAEVRDLGVAGLSRAQGDMSPAQFAEFPIARKVMYDHVELIHHGAEICLLRDLYRQRSARLG